MLDRSSVSRALEPNRLGFNCADDAINFGRELSKRGNDWLAANNPNVAERYVKGDVNLALKFRSSTEPHEFDLVFRRVPLAISKLARSDDPTVEGTNRVAERCKSHWDDHAMRIGVPYSVEANEQVVPSRVWLEAHKERVDFRRNIFKFPASQFTFKVGGIVGKRESGPLRRGVAESDGGGIDRVVERVSQVPDGILERGLDVSRHPSGQPDLVHILTGFRIVVGDTGIWPRIEEGFNFPFESIDVLACAIEDDARALEMVVGI